MIYEGVYPSGGLHNSRVKIRAAEISAGYERILVSEAFLGSIRTTYESVDLDHRRLGTDIHNLICDIGSQDILNPEFQRLGGTQDIYVLAVVRQCEAYVRTGKRHPDELCDDMFEFYIVRFKELASCRNIVEKVADTEIGTPRCSHLISGEVL